MSGSQVLVLVVGGFGACVGLLFFLYNVLSFALFLREPTEGSASPLARAAWGAGLAALFLWWMPLVGAAIATAAMLAARVEQGRIYRDAAPLAGVTPIRLGHLDGAVVLALQAVMLLATALAVISNAVAE